MVNGGQGEPATRLGAVFADLFHDPVGRGRVRSAGDLVEHAAGELAAAEPVGEAVEIGLDDNSMVRVASGVKEGEPVLLTPPLKAGAMEPGAKLADGASGRVGYLFYKGLVTFRPGFSGSSVRVSREAGLPGFRLDDFAVDATVTAGPFAVFGQFFVRDGLRQSPDTSGARLAYDDGTAGLVGLRAEFPTVTFRYAWTQWRYHGSRTTEWLHQPAVVWTPRKGIEATVEFLARRIEGPGGGSYRGAFRFDRTHEPTRSTGTSCCLEEYFARQSIFRQQDSGTVPVLAETLALDPGRPWPPRMQTRRCPAWSSSR